MVGMRLTRPAALHLTYDVLLSAPQTSQAGSVRFDLHF